MRSHVTVLAWLHIVLGGLTLLGAAMVFLLFAGTATLAATSGEHGSGSAALVMGGVGTFVFIAIAIFALPQLILGWGLLQGAQWARILGIVMSILCLIHPAFGLMTALGIYGLVVLFNQDTIAMFEGSRSRSY